MMESAEEPSLFIFISTCAGNAARRRSIRRSWFQYKLSEDGPLTIQQRQRIQLVFIASKGHEELITEAVTEKDILLLDTPEGYDMLWRKVQEVILLQSMHRATDAVENRLWRSLKEKGLTGLAWTVPLQPLHNYECPHMPTFSWQSVMAVDCIYTCLGILCQVSSIIMEPGHRSGFEALVFLQTLVSRCNATSSSHTDATQNKDEGDIQNKDVGNDNQWSGWTGPGSHPTFVMHADDDSYVRLDLLLKEMDSWPRTRHYWGYIWDGTGARCTAPIRNPLNKSYMPESQYAPDYYPPFASGCGFVLSWDLVRALAEAAPTLPDYRLLDPPFGIHLCGLPELCVVQPPITPVHEERVRPYRPLPTFRPDTIVQHYLKAEEMRPFHSQALESIDAALHGKEATITDASCAKSDGLGNGINSASQLYDTLVTMGLLRR